jgi:lactoylglutathione lyase
MIARSSRSIRRCFATKTTTTPTTASSTERPFRILGVQQIAIGSLEREPLRHLWKDIFGLVATSSHRLEKENVEEDILKLGIAPYEVEIDLMTPIDPDQSPKVCVRRILD